MIEQPVTKPAKPAEDQRLGLKLWGAEPEPIWRRAVAIEHVRPAPPLIDDAPAPGAIPTAGSGRIRLAARGSDGTRKWFSISARTLAVKAIEIEAQLDRLSVELRARGQQARRLRAARDGGAAADAPPPGGDAGGDAAAEDDAATPAERHRAKWLEQYATALCDAAEYLERVQRAPSVSRWHNERKAAILRAHPEVAKLLGPEPLTPIVATLVALVHLAAAAAAPALARLSLIHI